MCRSPLNPIFCLSLGEAEICFIRQAAFLVGRASGEESVAFVIRYEVRDNSWVNEEMKSKASKF